MAAPNGWLSPTSQCLTIEQFKRFKCGDKYFYTSNVSNPNPFTAEQLTAIKGATFASLVCQHTDLATVPWNAFAIPSTDNPQVSCNQYSAMNLNAWKRNPFL